MKYMGSKNRIAKDILPIILQNKTRDRWYIEPFCGGCNLIDKVEGKRIANDNNKYLIAMWKALVYDKWIPPFYSKEQYKVIKENKDSYPDYIVGWAGFNCSYNGIFFAGYSGEITTKLGTKRNYQQEALRNINKQIPKLTDVMFTNNDYRNIEIPDNSIIYCDPPYEGVSQYKTGTFNSADFWNWVRDISRKHEVYVSEYNAPDDFEILYEKELKTTISPNSTKIALEKLFRCKNDLTK